ncbi:MAG: peptide deformylase [Solirubrobacterales bacterium]
MGDTPEQRIAEDPQAQNDERELEPAGLTPAELRSRQAALARLRQWGDPVLRSDTRPVERFDDKFKADVRYMIELMHDAFGIGLAAPQIGRSRRVFVYQVGDQPAIVLANPTVEYLSQDEETALEGCLSLANVQVDVNRPVHVRVTGQDINGDEITIEASGLEARVIQHEFDHLNGVLILDRASKDQRRAALRALLEAEEQSGFAA